MDKNLFIGREYEIRQLEKYRSSKESEFIIVYGRRRVGKTSMLTSNGENPHAATKTQHRLKNKS